MSMDGAQETKAAVGRLDRLFESRLKLTRGDFDARAAKARLGRRGGARPAGSLRPGAPPLFLS